MLQNLADDRLLDPARLHALHHALDVDAAARRTFDRLARLGARALRAPVAQINMIAPDRQVSLSSVGPGAWNGPREVPISHSYCASVVRTGEALAVEDARADARVSSHPATVESGVVSYAAVPVSVDGGLVLGTVCVVDFVARSWDEEDLALLGSLADVVGAEIHRRGHTETELTHVTALLESAEDAVIGVDTEGIVISWNRGAERMLGRAAHEILGRHIRTIAPAECHAELRQAFRRALDGEELPRYVTERVRGDGNVVPVSRVLMPVRDLGGRVIGVTGVLRDLSAQVSSEAALQRSEARFRALIERSAELITVVSADGVVIYDSPAVERILGYTPEERAGTSLFAYVRPDDVAIIQERFASLLGRGTAEAEVRVRHRDGSYRVLAAVGVNLIDEPAVGGIVVNSRDVTELRAGEERLRQSQRMEAVGRLAGGIAHDFNNILTVITSTAQIARLDLDEGDPLRADLEEIERAAGRAASLTSQLLAFSRQQVLEPRVLDLNDVVREAERMLRRTLGEDIRFVTRLDDDTGRVLADEGQVEQILMNLAVNARDAMPHGGSLVLETRRVAWSAPFESPFGHEVPPGNYTLLSVTDSGSGMPPEVRARIFEPFFTTKERGKGTGLGLATVFGIVRQSGGFIWVYSEPGIGTSFKIYLPEAEGEAAPIDPATLPAPDPIGGTVLLVEDDPAVRRVARRVLERSGFTVVEAENGVEALEVAAGHEGPIDLLLTDVIMPVMGGRELAGRLTEAREGMRVLFTSGYTDESIAHHGVLEPGTHLLQKPYGPDELVRRVAELLADAA